MTYGNTPRAPRALPQQPRDKVMLPSNLSEVLHALSFHPSPHKQQRKPDGSTARK
jgi:hypothetical protein